MPNINYNLNIPDGPNNPSRDQPKMKINTNAVNTILNVDHIGFNDDDGGLHQQVHFNDKNAAGAVLDPESILFTGSGSASSVSQLLYRNQNATLPISGVRAFTSFITQVALGAVSPVNSYNLTAVNPIQKIAGGSYTITLDTNVVDTTTQGIVLLVTSGTSGLNFGYSFVNPTITITGIGVGSSGNRIDILVLQF